MLYFARIKGGVVTEVIVCESEELCVSLFGGQWVETTMGESYAGPGYLYHEDTKTLTTPQPYPSWSLSKDKTEWMPPTPQPKSDTPLVWDEKDQQWKSISDRTPTVTVTPVDEQEKPS